MYGMGMLTNRIEFSVSCGLCETGGDEELGKDVERFLKVVTQDIKVKVGRFTYNRVVRRRSMVNW